jgi:hypothetical protein
VLLLGDAIHELSLVYPDIESFGMLVLQLPLVDGMLVSSLGLEVT